MRNNTPSKIIVHMKNIDQANRFKDALQRFANLAGTGGDAELVIRKGSGNEFIVCGFIADLEAANREIEEWKIRAAGLCDDCSIVEQKEKLESENAMLKAELEEAREDIEFLKDESTKRMKANLALGEKINECKQLRAELEASYAQSRCDLIAPGSDPPKLLCDELAAKLEAAREEIERLQKLAYTPHSMTLYAGATDDDPFKHFELSVIDVGVADHNCTVKSDELDKFIKQLESENAALKKRIEELENNDERCHA